MPGIITRKIVSISMLVWIAGLAYVVAAMFFDSAEDSVGNVAALFVSTFVCIILGGQYLSGTDPGIAPVRIFFTTAPLVFFALLLVGAVSLSASFAYHALAAGAGLRLTSRALEELGAYALFPAFWHAGVCFFAGSFLRFALGYWWPRYYVNLVSLLGRPGTSVAEEIADLSRRLGLLTLPVCILLPFARAALEPNFERLIEAAFSVFILAGVAAACVATALLIFAVLPVRFYLLARRLWRMAVR